MSHTGLLTADSFFGKAMTVEGLARWVRFRIEQARSDWRGLCLLHALIFLLWVICRPFRKRGVWAVEPPDLKRTAVILREVSAELQKVISSARVSGQDSRLFFRRAFCVLSSYRHKLETLASLLDHQAEEWEQVVSDYGAEVLRKATEAVHGQEAAPVATPSDPSGEESGLTSLEPRLLRDHVGRVLSSS